MEEAADCTPPIPMELALLSMGATIVEITCYILIIK